MRAAICALLSMCAVASGQCTGGVTGFNTEEYLGKWYQIAVSKEFFDQFQATHPLCITAEYSFNPAGFVNVVNTAYNSTDGVISATGRATQADPNVGAFEVSFFGPFGAPYNVIKILSDANGKYSVALVWTCSDLYVLAREKTISDADYNTMIDFAKASGIDVDALQMQKTVQKCPCDKVAAITPFRTEDYLGKWYQIAVSKQFFDRLQATHPLCITAEYSLNPAGYINVVNTGYNRTGGVSSAIGKATQADASVGALEVSFFGPSASPYNVIKAISNRRGEYRVALVWSCSQDGARENMWVLSRRRTLPYVIYRKLLRFAAHSGINVDKLQMQRTSQFCPRAALPPQSEAH